MVQYFSVYNFQLQCGKMSNSINPHPTETISYINQHILTTFSMDCPCLQQLFMCWKLSLFPHFHTSFCSSFQCHLFQFWNASFSTPSFSSLPRYAIAHFWRWISNFIKTLQEIQSKNTAYKIKQCAFCSEIIFLKLVLVDRKWEKILFYFDTSILILLILNLKGLAGRSQHMHAFIIFVFQNEEVLYKLKGQNGNSFNNLKNLITDTQPALRK